MRRKGVFRAAATAAGAPKRPHYYNNVLGRRVRVWWELEDAWFNGVIRDYSATSEEHLIVYEDGEQRHYKLHHPRWRWEFIDQPQHGGVGAAISQPAPRKRQKTMEEDATAADAAGAAAAPALVTEAEGVRLHLSSSTAVEAAVVDELFHQAAETAVPRAAAVGAESADPVRRRSKSLVQAGIEAASAVATDGEGAPGGAGAVRGPLADEADEVEEPEPERVAEAEAMEVEVEVEIDDGAAISEHETVGIAAAPPDVMPPVTPKVHPRCPEEEAAVAAAAAAAAAAAERRRLEEAARAKAEKAAQAAEAAEAADKARREEEATRAESAPIEAERAAEEEAERRRLEEAATAAEEERVGQEDEARCKAEAAAEAAAAAAAAATAVAEAEAESERRKWKVSRRAVKAPDRLRATEDPRARPLWYRRKLQQQREAQGFGEEEDSEEEAEDGEAEFEAEGGSSEAPVAEAEGFPLHLSRSSLSGYTGVCKRASGRFEARRRVGGTSVNLGAFDTAVEAAVAYARAAGQAPEDSDEDEVSAPELVAEGLRLHLSSRSSTGYAAVVKRAHGRFEASHKVDGRRNVYLGTFDTAVDAAVAYARTVGEYQAPATPAVATEADAGLRLHVSSSSNTGYTCVSKHASGRFQAVHYVSGRRFSLGLFDTAVEAAAAYARHVACE